MCDTNDKLMYARLEEPRARWQAGTKIYLITKADEGTDSGPTVGAVVRPSVVMMTKDSTVAIYTMGKAKIFFVIGIGDYSRIFPASNFRKAVDPVLRTFGDHW
jgi:hypothetical protein